MKREKLITLILIFSGIIFIENLYIRLILIATAILWFTLDLYEKKLIKSIGKNEREIYCEWESRINETDFLTNEESTLSSLIESNITLEKSLGNEYVFHTENDTGRSIYFSGHIEKTEENGFIIRASNKEDLQ